MSRRRGLFVAALALCALVGGCSDQLALPDIEQLRTTGSIEFQDVSIRNDETGQSIRSRAGYQAKGSTGLAMGFSLLGWALLVVTCVWTWRTRRNTPSGRADLRVYLALTALLALLPLGLMVWADSKLLVDRSTRIDIEGQTITTHSERLWRSERVSQPLGGAHVSLLYARTGRHAQHRIYVVRVGPLTVLQGYGSPEHQRVWMSLRDAIAEQSNLPVIHEVEHSYFDW